MKKVILIAPTNIFDGHTSWSKVAISPRIVDGAELLPTLLAMKQEFREKIAAEFCLDLGMSDDYPVSVVPSIQKETCILWDSSSVEVKQPRYVLMHGNGVLAYFEIEEA